MALRGGQLVASEAGLRRLTSKSDGNSDGLDLEPLLKNAWLLEDVQLQWLEEQTLHNLGHVWVEISEEVPEAAGVLRWRLPARPGSTPANAEQQSIQAWVDLPEPKVLDLRLQAREIDMQAVHWSGMLARWVPTWQAQALAGSFSLDGHWKLPLEAGHAHLIEMQWRSIDGYAPLMEPGKRPQDLSHVDLQGHARFAGQPKRDWNRKDSWSGRWHALVRWIDVDLRLQAYLGQEASSNSMLDLWMHSDRVDLGPELSERLGDPKTLTDLQGMLAPEGHVEIAAGVRLPEDWTRFGGSQPRLPVAVAVRSEGNASVAYVGGPNRRHGGERNLGFPRRVQEAQGSVVFTSDPNRDFSQRTGIIGVHGVVPQEIEGEASPAIISVSGGIWGPPITPERIAELRDHPESARLLANSRLEIRGRGLTFDHPLREAFDGLSGVPGIDRILPTYNPTGGLVNVDLDFWGKYGEQSAKSKLRIDGESLTATWKAFPVDLTDAVASVQVESDGGGEQLGRSVVHFTVQATSPATGAPIELLGHSLSQGRQTLRSWTTARVQQLNLRSSALSRALEIASPEAHKAFEQAHLAGWLGADVHVVQDQKSEPIVAYVQAMPEREGLRTYPAQFPMETSELRGTIAARAEIQPDPVRSNPPTIKWSAQADILGISGVKRNGFPLALRLKTLPDQGVSARIMTADVAVDSPLVVGAIGQYLANDSNRIQAFDSSAIPLEGRVSGALEVVLKGQDTGQAPEVDLNLELDLDRFGPNGTAILRDLRGQVTLSQKDGTWTGTNLTGILGETPVVLHSLRVEPKGRGSQVIVVFSAENVPIDRTHLEPLMDPELLRTLTTELGARGHFDMDHGKLTLLLPESGAPALRLQGNVEIRDAFIRLGLPVEIESTRKLSIDLWYEGQHVRAMGTIEGLVGRLAERNVRDADFQFTYVAPKLTIEEFDAEFEGGRLQSLGAEAEGAAGFVALDLVHPFRFSVSASMRGVDVGRLLAGVFNSDFANEGRLDGDLRLSGDVDHLTEVSGSGTALLTDSALWAIPVFQSLFAQLGFDTTATFKRMEARFRIANGRIEAGHMQIKSDLLALLGTGWVDFEGELSQDMEVRYSLVDQLGPLTKLLYRIQNSLLRVSIRGDMARPRVQLNGLFSQFFAGRDEQRQLPLPGLSELPERF